MSHRIIIQSVNKHKTKTLGAITIALGFIQTYPGLDKMIPAHIYPWVMMVIGLGVLVCGFLNTSADDHEHEEPPVNNQGGFARPLMLAFMLAIALPVTAVLHGCAALGLQQPQSTDQRIVYANKQLEAAATAIASTVRSRQLAPDKAQKALDLVKEGRTVSDAAAFALSVGDVTTAEGRLLALTAILTQVQTILNERAAP